MIELHPAVQHLADKGYERATMDEMAIVNLMRQSLTMSEGQADLLRRWLQELNPLKLRGYELVDWANEVSDWILPTHMRRSDAATKGIKQDSSQQQHPKGDSGRQASEASGGHSFTERRPGEVPYITETE